ncbi:MAG: GyrI-like domain-containing protein [Alphaproteobacteria bacterium]
MADGSTFNPYDKRIARVLAYIADHLDDRLDLDTLADVAAFSAFHFHRVYRSILGETVADTVRRRRLFRAAADLVTGPMPIARIARRAGYGSVAAFTRAFRAYYGTPPAAFRARGKPAPAWSEIYPMERTMTDVTITDREPVTVVAIPHDGDYQAIGDTFDRLWAWACGHDLIGPATRSFGIYYDDPEAVPRAKLRSEACLTMPDDAPLGEGMRRIEIPGGRYAVLRHRGPYAELERAYAALYKGWLPLSGEEPADRPCFEEYLNDCRTLPPTEWLTDVCLPLADRR